MEINTITSQLPKDPNFTPHPKRLKKISWIRQFIESLFKSKEPISQHREEFNVLASGIYKGYHYDISVIGGTYTLFVSTKGKEVIHSYPAEMTWRGHNNRSSIRLQKSEYYTDEELIEMAVQYLDRKVAKPHN